MDLQVKTNTLEEEIVEVDLTASDTFQIFKIKEESRLYLFLKRVMDVFLSSIALIVLSPIFLIVALAIKIEDKGPAFYKQIRIGKDETPFTMYKFRSMCLNAELKLKELEELNEREGPAFKIKDDPRITKVGKFIRKTCIDELPQLLNIIKGDMSIVGPRPPLPNEVAQYNLFQKQRLNVTPGLTCYWQVNKQETTTFDEWVLMDLEYISKRNIFIDIKLILLTLKVVFVGNGEG